MRLPKIRVPFSRKTLLAAIGLIILLLILVGVYEFGLRNGSSYAVLDKTEMLRLSKQCGDDGKTLLKQDIDAATRNKSNQGVLNCFYDDPEFIYNSSLNTCLYSGGYNCTLSKTDPSGFFTNGHATQWYRHVVDEYTNNTVTEIYVEDSSNISKQENKSINDFWDKLDQLGLGS